MGECRICDGEWEIEGGGKVVHEFQEAETAVFTLLDHTDGTTPTA